MVENILIPYWANFFYEKGTVHQRSCVDTLKQYCVVELKTKNLPEMVYTLLFTS